MLGVDHSPVIDVFYQTLIRWRFDFFVGFIAVLKASDKLHTYICRDAPLLKKPITLLELNPQPLGYAACALLLCYY